MQLGRDCSGGFLSILNKQLESGRERIYNRIPEKHRLDFEKFIQAKTLTDCHVNFSACLWKDKHRKTEFSIWKETYRLSNPAPHTMKSTTILSACHQFLPAQNVCCRTHHLRVAVEELKILKILPVRLISAFSQHKMCLITTPPLVHQIFIRIVYFCLCVPFWIPIQPPLTLKNPRHSMIYQPLFWILSFEELEQMNYVPWSLISQTWHNILQWNWNHHHNRSVHQVLKSQEFSFLCSWNTFKINKGCWLTTKMAQPDHSHHRVNHVTTDKLFDLSHFPYQ